MKSLLAQACVSRTRNNQDFHCVIPGICAALGLGVSQQGHLLKLEALFAKQVGHDQSPGFLRTVNMPELPACLCASFFAELTILSDEVAGVGLPTTPRNRKDIKNHHNAIE